MSTVAIQALARQLCASVTTLKHVHRSGLTPSFGQVEDLFDTSAALEHALEAEGLLEPKRKCSRHTCGEIATTTIGHLEYCQHCGDAVRNLLKSLGSFGIEAVRANWPTRDSGVVTGPDPRD